MSLVRVQTIWSGVAGSPYYTNLYALGPSATNNGNDLADAWRTFLAAIAGQFTTGLTAQIQPELLEFNEIDGVVTGAGSTIQAAVVGTASGDQLPHSQQFLLRWVTEGIVHNRRVRGRTFIPGPVETQNSATGSPILIHRQTIEDAAEIFLTTMAGRLRIWAQPFEGTEGNPARLGSAHAVTGANVADFWAVLRSRRD